MDEIRVGVTGCAGRMGRMVLKCLADTPEAQIVGGTEPAGSPHLGADLGTLAGLAPLGLTASDDPVALFAKAQAVIEFTSPEATLAHAELAAQNKVAHIIGTTGLSAEQQDALQRAAKHAVIMFAPNMSLGVTLLSALVEQVAAALDADYDIEVVEMHHRRKVDAPSGTALALGEAAARGRQLALDTVACRARDGQVGARPRGEIGFATLRGGDVVGDHSVIFAAEGERIELTHKASSREVFARGAVKAALWAQGQGPGLYSMRDVLGLE